MNVVVICVVVVGNGMIVDTGVLVDGVVVVNSTVFPCVLIVALADLRRSGGATTPAKQRWRRRGWITSSPIRILVSAVVSRRNIVYIAIGWSRRGHCMSRRAALSVVVDEFVSIYPRIWWFVWCG